ncbi:hypothetical protein STEG23_000217, partial [Scotinomys teguina]
LNAFHGSSHVNICNIRDIIQFSVTASPSKHRSKFWREYLWSQNMSCACPLTEGLDFLDQGNGFTSVNKHFPTFFILLTSYALDHILRQIAHFEPLFKNH